MSPRPMLASTGSYDVNALLVQYTPRFNDLAANKEAIDKHLSDNTSLVTNLIVFPVYSLTRDPPSADDGKNLASSAQEIDNYFANVAKRHDSYVIYRFRRQRRR